MVAASKLFQDVVALQPCSNGIVHTGGCGVNALKNAYLFLFGNLRYFAPICLLPLLTKLDRLNKRRVLDAFRYYVGSSLLGATTGLSIATLICIFRYLLGRFTPLTLLILPSFIGGAPIFLAPKRPRDLFVTSVLQAFIETFIVRGKRGWARLLSDSKWLKTWIFMCCSAVIMQAQRMDLYKGFWLLRANAKEEPVASDAPEGQVPTSSCTHKEPNCVLHVLRGMRSYLVLGIILDIIKMLMSKAPAGVEGLPLKLLAKLNNLHLQSACFFTSYVGIYRAAHCVLLGQNVSDLQLAHLIASFLGGLAFMFYPQLSLLTFAVVTSLKITFAYIYEHETLSQRYKLLAYLKKVPYGNLLYCAALGHLCHVMALRRHYISPLGQTLIDGVTNNYGSQISNRIRHLATLHYEGIQ